ncbi:Hypothetical protein PHPALM_13896 [Phytophthora palmivora]|uniref:PiggyBac transposable element-derived protein domain-containing protein n=1 Tax=Phytophthora palmivora TaxID=4796 RepID=A0A2P4XWF5_9STRA|nr:Hypothetical protein PHPALM_13896 [Phytophthora palmivora]
MGSALWVAMCGHLTKAYQAPTMRRLLVSDNFYTSYTLAKAILAFIDRGDAHTEHSTNCTTGETEWRDATGGNKAIQKGRARNNQQEAHQNDSLFTNELNLYLQWLPLPMPGT